MFSKEAREQWRVTIVRNRSRFIAMILLGVGIVIGMLWVYGPASTFWTNANPVHLTDNYQEEWVKMTAHQFAVTSDDAQARARLSEIPNPVGIIDRLVNENAANNSLVNRLNAIRPFAAEVSPGTPLPQPSLFQSLGVFCFIPFLIVGFIVVAAWSMYGMMLTSVVRAINPIKRRGAVSEEDQQRSAAERDRRDALERARAAQATMEAQREAAGVALPPPIVEYTSAYTLGQDFYDDSFSIEDKANNNAFLGECGAGISETLDLETPKKVVAFEVWLFDKNDIRTVTKVVMSDYAFNDASGLRARLAPKGDPVLARPGAQIELETMTLRLVATIIDVTYGAGAAPPNSFFQQFTLNLAAYPKEGAAAPPETMPDPYGGTMPL